MGRSQDDLAADLSWPVEDRPWEVAARCFRAWRAGDRSMLDTMVRAISPGLWQIARSYGLDRASAEDVVQTTWLTLLAKSDQVRDEQAVLAWLTMTTRREAWNVARREDRAYPTDDAELDGHLPVTSSTETEVLHGQAQRALWASVGKLDPRCQHLLRVIAFDPRPDYANLAGLLGLSVGSIGPTRGRCLAKLRRLLAATEERR